MIKVIIVSVILSILIITLLYLAFSFGYADFNINHWDICGRAMCSTFMFMGTMMCIVFPLVNYYDNIKK